MLWVIHLSLILFNTSWGIYSILKEPKYAAVFLSIDNETQYVHLLFLSSRFVTYASSFVLYKLSLEKTPLNLGLELYYLLTLMLLKGWGRTKEFYPRIFFWIVPSIVETDAIVTNGGKTFLANVS